MTSLNRPGGNRSIKFIMGKSVTVTCDRTYTVVGEDKKRHVVNCGYVRLADGKIDRPAYIIGVEEPVAEYTGDIISAVHVKNEKKDAWVIAPPGKVYCEPAIRTLLSRFIRSKNASYACLYEKSCGAVMFSEESGVRKFILIKNMSGHIGFPKGHMEYGESEYDTAKREIYEETGVKTDIIDGFCESYNYSVNSFVRKTAVYFVAPYRESDIKMDIMEISEYILVTFEEGMKILGYSHDRTVLAKANKFIDGIVKDSGKSAGGI